MPSIKATVIALLLAAAFPAAAAEVLYRADARPPEIMFMQGFTPPGTNTNLFDHVSGRSCYGVPGVAPTAYVALTSYYDPVPFYDYVYRIIPDADAPEHIAVYDVAAGLDYIYAARASLRLDVRQLANLERLRAFPLTPGLFLSRDIPSQWIASVDVYAPDPRTGQRVFVRTDVNPHWVPARQPGTRAPFPLSMAAAMNPANVIVLFRRPDAPNDIGRYVVGACQADCARAARRSTSAGTAAGALSTAGQPADDAVCVAEPMYDGRDVFSRTLQVILD